MNHAFAQDTAMIAKPRLDAAALLRFEAELDALRLEVADDLGERDARHIRRVRGFAQGSAIAGRGLVGSFKAAIESRWTCSSRMPAVAYNRLAALQRASPKYPWMARSIGISP